MYKAIFILFSLAVVFMIIYSTYYIEHYDRMSYFPWNEANLVRKRHPSSVIDCAWDLSDDGFDTSFQVVRPFQHTDPAPPE